MAETIIGCNEFQSIGIGCKDNIGGLKNFWIASFENFSFTIDADTDAGHIVTGITTGVTALYEITPARASAFATEVQAVDNTNTIWQQDISLIYSKNQATLRNFVSSIAKSIVIGIGQDRNNNFWLYGSDNGLQAGTEQATGTVETDKNTWTIKLQAKESYPALSVSASVMTPYL